MTLTTGIFIASRILICHSCHSLNHAFLTQNTKIQGVFKSTCHLVFFSCDTCDSARCYSIHFVGAGCGKREPLIVWFFAYRVLVQFMATRIFHSNTLVHGLDMRKTGHHLLSPNSQFYACEHNVSKNPNPKDSYTDHHDE